LFVMLHGCTQDPDTFAKGTKMNDYAEQYEFLVLYPIQTTAGNTNKCWNWFLPKHQARGTAGEPDFIAGATEAVTGLYKIDEEAVFCAGLSAGAAMTVIMGATYPDVYTSLGVAAGLEFQAANSALTAYTAMSSGGPAPRTQAAKAYNAMKTHVKWPIEVLVVHGTSDYTVAQINGQQVTEQWIFTDNLVLGVGRDSGRISTTPSGEINGKVPNGYTYTDFEFSDIETGVVLIHYLKVNTMGHAWSGGSTAGSYTDPKGPDASLFMVNWFLQYDKSLVQGRNVSSLSVQY